MVIGIGACAVMAFAIAQAVLRPQADEAAEPSAP
jgi:hypothetical protein